jgi:hypothetical protein
MNELFLQIQTHLCLLDLALDSSSKIHFFASTADVDSLVNETENRERLVNVIGQIQAVIEKKISSLGQHELESDTISILKCWFSDLANWSEKMIAFDRETVELLADQKENTTKEIATIFKNKEIIKGYNHSVKK